MDFRISADDRVGAQPNRGAKPQARAAKGSRVEPSLGQSVGGFVDDERSGGPIGGGDGGKPPRGKKPARAEKQPRRGKAETARPKKRRSRSGG